MQFVQNFPFFCILLTLICAVITSVLKGRQARWLTMIMITVVTAMTSAVMVYTLTTGDSYVYMMGHFPAPWGNEIRIGVMETTMMMVFCFVMLFSFVGTEARIEKELESIEQKEMLVSKIALSAIAENENYQEKMASSLRDTVTLAVSKVVVEEHKGVVNIVDEICLTPMESPDTLLAVVPTVLIVDQVLVKKDDVYVFSCENDIVKAESISVTDAVAALMMVFSNVVSHLPLLMLLTAPFLVLALSIILRRRKYPRGDLYVFSYYYMAFVELLLTVMYILGVIFGFSFSSVSWLLRISLFAYLTIAMKRCYDISTWGKSAIAALFVNAIYVVSCFTFITIFCLVVFVIALLPMVM